MNYQETVSCHVRDLSCLLRCSLLLNALAQYWHLYFLSGCAADVFRGAGVAAAVATDVGGATATLAAGILTRCVPLTMVGILVW